MANLKQGDLEIKMDESGSNVTLLWLGKSGEQKPGEVLTPYFTQIINSLKGKKVTLDYTQLKFMNSSTVPPIIQFLKELNTSEINTQIFYNKDSKWQTASFKAIETLTKILNKIEVVGK